MNTYTSDFSKKMYISPIIKDLDLHEIIDLKTYLHDFVAPINVSNRPENFNYLHIDDFWDMNDQNFIIKTTHPGN